MVGIIWPQLAEIKVISKILDLRPIIASLVQLGLEISLCKIDISFLSGNFVTITMGKFFDQET